MALRPFRTQAGQAVTLQLRWPVGQSLAFAAVILVVYLAVGEFLIRRYAARILPGVPSLGSHHRQFEEQWFRLENYVAERKSIDCIFVGDSTVQTDFSPQVFADSFHRQTGRDLDCFNFGVGAFSAVGFAALTQILVQEYSPRLLLVGVEALNFAVPVEEQGEADLASTAWARHRLGDFVPTGWLYENMRLYRYLGVLRQLITATINGNDIMQWNTGDRGGLKDGFYPMTGTGAFDVSRAPQPEMEHPYLEHYFAALRSFRLLPENLEALDTILTLDGRTTKIVMVEMPVPSTFHTFFGCGEQDYQAFIDTLANEADLKGVPLLRMESPELLPSHVWFNYNHLNSDGAPLFSNWLAQQLGQGQLATFAQVKTSIR